MVLNQLRWKFRLLLLTLCSVILVVPPIAELSAIDFSPLSMIIITLSVLWATGKTGFRYLIVPILVAITLIIACTLWPGNTHDALQFVAMTLVVAGAVWITVAYLRTADCVDIEVLAAAIVAYLLFGIGFGSIYAAMGIWSPGGIILPEHTANLPVLDNYIYFSFVVLTTLGFGDMQPADALHRSLTIIESICGVFYIAIGLPT